MADIDERIRELKLAIDVQQRAKAKAEMERDAAAATVEIAKAKLAKEFGTESVTEAKGMLAVMNDDLEQAVDAAFELLERANA